MANKYELVLTRWEDGIFKSRNRIEVDGLYELESELDTMVVEIQDRINEENESKFKIAEDDDIPF